MQKRNVYFLLGSNSKLQLIYCWKSGYRHSMLLYNSNYNFGQFCDANYRLISIFLLRSQYDRKIEPQHTFILVRFHCVIIRFGCNLCKAYHKRKCVEIAWETTSSPLSVWDGNETVPFSPLSYINKYVHCIMFAHSICHISICFCPLLCWRFYLYSWIRIPFLWANHIHLSYLRISKLALFCYCFKSFPQDFSLYQPS